MASYPWPLMTPPHPDAVDHFVTAPEPEPLTEDDLAALEEKMSWDEPKSWNDFLHVAYYEDVPRLIAEVRRLRDEREALTMTIEAGFASGRCPACEPRFERGGDLYAHDPECPFRNWRQDGIDVAALTATYRALKAETATFLRQWEAEHPEQAEKLRRRVAELAERP